MNENCDFRTYELNMDGQEESFGDIWQDNYDAEHAKMFADNAEGEGIRAGIRTEHEILYRSSCIGTKTGVLDNSADFLKLLNYGRRDGRLRVFTYAMMDDGWYFSETGAAMVADFMSKHAVHANARGKVRFSGTMRIIQNPKTKEYALVPDNDSGTYRPKEEQLVCLQKCINANFPNLKVMPLSCLKPQPEEMKSWWGPQEVSEKHGGTADCVYPGKWVWVNNDDEEEEEEDEE